MAAAAGIAALIGAREPAELLALAQSTFRCVSLDKLEPRHLASNEPAAEAFLISTPATLGSVDAFLSHSWHDPPAEKWRLLQQWRAEFVRTNSREANIWLDRCCIDPSNLEAALPLLPIYLASCDKLLALRGPTYLNRLWCARRTPASRAVAMSTPRAPVAEPSQRSRRARRARAAGRRSQVRRRAARLLRDEGGRLAHPARQL